MSDYQLQKREEIDDTDYDYQVMNTLKKVPFELLLEMYADYRASNIWEHEGFKDTFSFLQYGVALRRELSRRDKKGSRIV